MTDLDSQNNIGNQLNLVIKEKTKGKNYNKDFLGKFMSNSEKKKPREIKENLCIHLN